MSPYGIPIREAIRRSLKEEAEVRTFQPSIGRRAAVLTALALLLSLTACAPKETGEEPYVYHNEAYGFSLTLDSAFTPYLYIVESDDELGHVVAFCYCDPSAWGFSADELTEEEIADLCCVFTPVRVYIDPADAPERSILDDLGNEQVEVAATNDTYRYSLQLFSMSYSGDDYGAEQAYQRLENEVLAIPDTFKLDP